MKRQLSTSACILFLSLCVARPGRADIVTCNDFPSVCSQIVNFSVTGGSRPYVVVEGSQGNFLDPSNPSQIAYSFGNSAASEVGVRTLATGILTATDTTASTYGDYDSVSIAANDIFTLSGPAGSSVSITADFTVAGTANLSAVAPYGSSLISGGGASIELCGPGGSFACGGDQFNDTFYTGLGASFPGYSGPLVSGNFSGDVSGTQDYLEHSFTWTQQVGTPFDVYYAMTAYTYGGTVDLTDPGTLSFDLPSGYSLQSLGGFSSPSPSAVPESSSVTLFAFVLAMTGYFRYRFRRRGYRGKQGPARSGRAASGAVVTFSFQRSASICRKLKAESSGERHASMYAYGSDSRR
jgi:hypothetical protein